MLSKFMKLFPLALSNYPLQLICILQSRVVKAVPRANPTYFWAERSCPVHSVQMLPCYRLGCWDSERRAGLAGLHTSRGQGRAVPPPSWVPVCLQGCKWTNTMWSPTRPEWAPASPHISFSSNLDVTSSMHLKCKSTLTGQTDYFRAIQQLKDLGILQWRAEWS